MYINVYFVYISVNQPVYLNQDYWRFLHSILSCINDNTIHKSSTGGMRVIISKSPLIIPLISLAEYVATEQQITHQITGTMTVATECFRLLAGSQHRLFRPSFEHLTTLFLSVCTIYKREEIIVERDEHMEK